MKKVKIFISVGMRGRTDEAILSDIQRAKDFIMRDFTEDQVEIIHTFTTEPPEDKRRLACLGESIKVLGECDMCFFCDGYRCHRGCMVEQEVCNQYGIKTLYEDYDILTEDLLAAIIQEEIEWGIERD